MGKKDAYLLEISRRLVNDLHDFLKFRRVRRRKLELLRKFLESFGLVARYGPSRMKVTFLTPNESLVGKGTIEPTTSIASEKTSGSHASRSSNETPVSKGNAHVKVTSGKSPSGKKLSTEKPAPYSPEIKDRRAGSDTNTPPEASTEKATGDVQTTIAGSLAGSAKSSAVSGTSKGKGKKTQKAKLVAEEEMLKNLRLQELRNKLIQRRLRREKRLKLKEHRHHKMLLRFIELRKIFSFTKSLRKMLKNIMLTEEVLNGIEPLKLSYLHLGPPTLTTDHRILWLKEKVMNYFSIERNSSFIDLWYRKNGFYKDLITDFLFGSFGQDFNNAILFFSETKWSKTYYKTVYVTCEKDMDELDYQQRREYLPQVWGDFSPVSSGLTLSSATPDKSGLSPTSSGLAISVQSTSTTRMNNNGSPKTPIKVMLREKVIVKYKKNVSQLHLTTLKKICSYIKRGLKYDQNFFYVLRKPTSEIPFFDTYDEAYAQMPKYFHVGNFKISSLTHQYYGFIQMFKDYLFNNLPVPTMGLDEVNPISCFISKKYKSRLTWDNLSGRTLLPFCCDCRLIFFLYCLQNNILPLKQKRDQTTNSKFSKRHAKVNWNKSISKNSASGDFPISSIETSDKLTQQPRNKYYKIENSWLNLISRTEYNYISLKKASTFSFNIHKYISRYKTLNSLLEDKLFVSSLSNKFKDWRKYIKHLKNYAVSEVPKDAVSVYEFYHYWKKREVLIYPFLLRLCTTSFKMAFNIMIQINSELCSDFLSDVKCLEITYRQAKKNCIVLRGPLQIFTNMYKSASTKNLLEILSGFLKFVRMDWVIAAYVNDPHHFLSLIGRVQHILLQASKQILEINNFLLMSSSKAQKTALQVIYVMVAWKNQFLKLFNVQELHSPSLIVTFKSTEFALLININNMAKMAYDFFYLAKNYGQLTQIFDPRLASITKESYEVNIWHHKCQESTYELRTTNYDIFDFANDKRWDNLLRQWYMKLPILRQHGKLLLDKLFNRIRNSVQTIEYLSSTKTGSTSSIFFLHLMKKFKNCRAKFIDEVRECVMGAEEAIRDNLLVIYRNQPLESGIIVWLDNLMKFIYQQLKSVAQEPQVWDNTSFSQIKRVFYAFLEFYRLKYTISLITFMTYKSQCDFYQSKLSSTGHIEIKCFESGDLSSYYSDDQMAQLKHFLSYRMASVKNVRTTPEANYFEEKTDHINLMEIVTDVTTDVKRMFNIELMPPELLAYCEQFDAIKVSTERRKQNFLSKFVSSFYRRVFKKSSLRVKRINLNYTMYDIFLYSGKISTSFLSRGMIKQNVSKYFFLSNDGESIYLASQFHVPNFNEDATDRNITSALRSSDDNEPVTVKSPFSESIEDKLLGQDVLKLDFNHLKPILMSETNQIRFSPKVKYLFVSKFSVSQNEELGLLIESKLHNAGFPYDREILVLAILRELITRSDIETLLKSDHLYKENPSVIPLVFNSKHLTPLREFMLMSTIYRQLNSKQLSFLELMLIIFQHLFFKELSVNRSDFTANPSENVDGSLISCSLSSSESNRLDDHLELKYYSYENSYFDEYEYIYDSDNLFGCIITLADLMIFRNKLLFNCDALITSTDFQKKYKKRTDHKCKPKIFFSKFLSPEIKVTKYSALVNLLIEFIAENGFKLLQKSSRKIEKFVESEESCDSSSKYPEFEKELTLQLSSPYNIFDDLYSVDSRVSELFGSDDKVEVYEDEDVPSQMPELFSLRRYLTESSHDWTSKPKRDSSSSSEESVAASDDHVSENVESDLGMAHISEEPPRNQGGENKPVSIPEEEAVVKRIIISSKESLQRETVHSECLSGPNRIKIFLSDKINERFYIFTTHISNLVKPESNTIFSETSFPCVDAAVFDYNGLRPDSTLKHSITCDERFKTSATLNDTNLQNIGSQSEICIESNTKNCKKYIPKVFRDDPNHGSVSNIAFWPVKHFMEFYFHCSYYLKTLRLPWYKTKVISNNPYILSKFGEASRIKNEYKFYMVKPRRQPRDTVRQILAKKLPTYYEVQSQYHNLAKELYRKFTKCPRISASNKYVDRIFKTYVSYTMRRQSKCNEVPLTFMDELRKKHSKNNKFIAWRYLYFQSEKPKFNNVQTLLQNVNHNFTHSVINEIINDLRSRWNGFRFVKGSKKNNSIFLNNKKLQRSDQNKILEQSWCKIMLKYPFLYRKTFSNCTFDKSSCDVKVVRCESCVDDFMNTDNNNLFVSIKPIKKGKTVESAEIGSASVDNNSNGVALKDIRNPNPHKIIEKKIFCMQKNSFNGTNNVDYLTNINLDQKFREVMPKILNKNKLIVTFKQDKKFYEHILNAKHLIGSSCFIEDVIMKFICNDYPYLVKQIHGLLDVILCYNRFVLQLNEEEVYFFQDFLKVLIFSIHQNIRNYLSARFVTFKSQQFIKDTIFLVDMKQLRILRETSQMLTGHFMKLKYFNWFLIPECSMPLKSYIKSCIMSRDFTCQQASTSFNSAKHYFQLVEFLIHNHFADKVDNPQFLKYFESYEILYLSSTISNIHQNVQFLKEFLRSSDCAYPTLHLNFEDGNFICYNESEKYIGILMIKFWMDFMERYHLFSRWMSGTSEKVRCIQVVSSKMTHRFTVYDEMASFGGIEEPICKSLELLHESINALAEYKDRWNLFDEFYTVANIFTKSHMLNHENFMDTEIMTTLFYSECLSKFISNTEESVQVAGYRIGIDRVVEHYKKSCERFSRYAVAKIQSEISSFCSRSILECIEMVHRCPPALDLLEAFIDYSEAIPKINMRLYELMSSIYDAQNTLLATAKPGLQFEEEYSTTAYCLEKLIFNIGLYIDFFKMRNGRCSAYTLIIKEKAECFRAKFREFSIEYWLSGPRTCSENLNLGLKLIQEYKPKFETLDNERKQICSLEQILESRVSEFPLFDAIYEDFQIQSILFQLYRQLKDDFDNWNNYYWRNYDSSKIANRVDLAIEAFNYLPLELRNYPVARSLRKLFDDVGLTIPILDKLRIEEFKSRHWKQLRRRTRYKRNFDIFDPELKLDIFFKWELHKFPEVIDELLDYALNEAVVKHRLGKIIEALNDLSIQIRPYYNDMTYRGIALDTNDEVLIAIDDFTLELQSLTSTPYCAPYLKTIHRWELILLVVSEVLSEWLNVQRKWRYLESVFLSGDMRNQLPKMAVKFDQVDKTYLLMTLPLMRRRQAINECMKPDIFNKFIKLTEVLDECQKNLVNYLDTKRNAFPRFYFISNDELLSVLASQSPEGIQDQMFKIFDNVCKLRFLPQKSKSIRKRTVAAMVSCENEVLDFYSLRSTNAAIEKWLTGIVNEMRKSLKQLTKESILLYGRSYKSRLEWMFNTLGVCVMATNKTYWTANVELAFQRFKRGYKKAMIDLLALLKDQINNIVLKVRGSLAKNDRKKLNTVLIVDVHSKDIVGKLVSESITKRSSFEWECQLRYYWKTRHQSLRLRQCSGFFQYGYEYMGLNGRLVITPLTDRIFLTITQALALKMGGAPAGPAGTGKTETTKDLAKAMGRLCMVTNCGENMDYIQFGKILMGLCQAGAWGCFDEFNRIDISVLSVITTQLQIIRSAFQEETSGFFKFEGYKIYLDHKCGIFITMNPGYAGRTELPETLKALFRPVVCIVPDLEHICLIMLFSEGFLTAKILAKKMTLLYSLSKDRLSKQSHYDFGLRSLKPVLTVAGDLKRNSPHLEEDVVIMRALRDMNKPKLVPEDEGLFLELISDLFPGIECDRVTYPAFDEAVKQVLHAMDYIIIDGQINKVIQFYETLMTRHSVAIVGPTRSGKTVIVNTLCEAQKAMDIPTMIVVLNPKAFTVDELYGILDPKTREWIDGLLSNAFREMNQPIKRPEKRFIMFDGDVDALWIENMNSVMDDNKILTLTSGERMRLLDHSALLFEVGDLRYASPATVSRCGVVFVDSETVGYKAVWERWLYRRNSTDQELFMLIDLFDKFIPTTLNTIFKGSLAQKTKPMSFIIPQNEVNLISQLCYILESTLPKPQKGRQSLVERPFLEETDTRASDTTTEHSAQHGDKVPLTSSKAPKKVDSSVPKAQHMNINVYDLFYPRDGVRKYFNDCYFYTKPPVIFKSARGYDGSCSSTVSFSQGFEECLIGHQVYNASLRNIKKNIQKSHKKKELSFVNFPTDEIKQLLRRQQRISLKILKKRVVDTRKTFSNQMFKLKQYDHLIDDHTDIFPENKILSDWLGSHYCETFIKYDKARDIDAKIYFKNRIKSYRKLSKIVKDQTLEYTYQQKNEQRAIEVGSPVTSHNELIISEGEIDKSSFPIAKETYGLRKLSYQYRGVFHTQKQDTGPINIERRKTLSLERKKMYDEDLDKKMPKLTLYRTLPIKLSDAPIPPSLDTETMEKEKNREKMRAIFIEAMYASLGATLVERDRTRFDDFVKKVMDIPEYPDTPTSLAELRFIPCKMPMFYDYKVDIEKHCWVPWSNILKPYVHDKNKKFDEIFVPTEESSRIGLFLMLMQSVQRPVILVGESGTAKTAIMMEFLRNISLDYIKITLTFSSRTTSLDVQRNIDTALDKINKNTLGPPRGKEMIIFIDDLNMPQFDEYGTQQPIALLKLTVEKNGLFDREGDLAWKNLQNVMFIGAMGMTARSDQVVDPRFTSHFSIFNLTPPSGTTINRIYVSILNGHLSDFQSDYHTVTADIMKATLEIFKYVRKDIPPSPIRFHYVFSLRDLSRLTCGLMQTTSDIFTTKKHFVRVWRNEIMRVFYDRLCLPDDQVKVQEYVTEVIEKEFSGIKNYVCADPLIFGDFENFMNPDEPRVYKDLKNYDVIFKAFSDILEDYNAHYSAMDLVLFEDALDHLTRIHRVLRLHRGNLLAIGVGGCGKRSLITLASYTAGCKMYSINLCKGYNESFFKEDLKKLYLMLGVDKIKTSFFFTASHIVQEDFLEYINSILTVGFLPTLFSDEDKDTIINKVRKDARAAGSGRTKEEIWNFFLDTCKQSLHMVLSMSPLGSTLRVRCRSVPSLVNNSTIDWIFPWPSAALFAVASKFLPTDLYEKEKRKLVIEHIVFTHKTAVNFSEEFLSRYNRTCFITPKHYLDFIKLYIKFSKEKSDDNLTRTREYELGLQKMVEAYITVETISEQTVKQKEIVEKQNIACEVLLKDLTAATSITTEKQNIAKAKSKEIEEQSIEINENKKEAEQALSTALPALNEARLALDQLNKNDITEIRSFATPPIPVQIVCECVLILQGYKEIDWKNAKGMMADPNFLQKLKNMNVDKITKSQEKKVREHLGQTTKMEQMAAISKAGYGLLLFVRAILNYCVVYRVVKPKKEKVEMLEKKFAKALQTLEKINEEVRHLEQTLLELNEKYTTAMKEKHRIQKEMDLMLHRLEVANKLLLGLSSENERWKKEHANLKDEYVKIGGNCLMTSSFLAYTGAFNWALRREMISETWLKNIRKLRIPFSSNYKLEYELMDEVSVSRLFTEGLPPDELSLQNALLVLCSSRFPLCIDPQQQALRWLTRREKPFNPKILTFDDNNCLNMLEAAVRSGTPVIIKDVEYVDPMLENLLEKNIRGKRGQKCVTIGNKEVEFRDSFRLYLVSKLQNPQFESWIYTKSTVVNCIVTVNGLEDQLLNVVARRERPDLEEAREKLIEQTNTQKQAVKFFEKTLLIELANAKGNILDNATLIKTLEDTKIKVTQMQEDLKQAELIKGGFEVTRNEYRPVAKRGSLLYFVLYDMSAMNPMYIYSLDSYLKVFVDALSRSVASIEISVRVKKFIAILTKKVYDYGCNGLFERDKLLFSFQISLRLQQSLEQVSEDEFTFLIKGDSSLDKCSVPCPAKWFPAERWKDLVKLNSEFAAFENILSDFEKNVSQWEKWYNLAAPEKTKVPYDNFDNLRPFEKLMLFRCLRVDRISECLPDYIDSIMGSYFNKPPLISMDQILNSSSPDEPVMFVLCPGANPIPKLIKAGEKYRPGIPGGGDSKMLIISLGQGQEPRATKMFFEGRRKGHWVIFENCHLLPFFIASIEKTREKQEASPHPAFRLWYTTEPTDKFPLSVLQTTSRVVMEVAESFKLNLARTIRNIDRADFKEQVRIHPSFGHIIYVLAFFHAVLLERKKFGQVGFNVNYDFSESDFDSCYQLIKRYLSKVSYGIRKTQKSGVDTSHYNQYLYDRVPWEILRYLIGEIVYGGRVIDYYDRRTVATYLEEYMDNFIYQSISTFCFFKRLGLKYPVPLYNSLSSYNRQIRLLPDTTFPGVYGLHPNVEIAYNDAKTTTFWKNLVSLQPAEGSASKAGSKKESLVNEIRVKIKDIVPREPYDIPKIKLKYKDYLKSFGISEFNPTGKDPTVIILFQELGMFNVLIESLSVSLESLRKAIRGEIAMDALLENIFDCLYEGEIPQPWRKLIPQTKKSLGQWMSHFKMRIEQYDEWLKQFKLPAIWMSGLHVPQSYLTAVMQRTARLQGWSLDETALYSFVTKMKRDKKVKSVPHLGCYIRDLFIQGARWDCTMHALQPPRRKIQVEPMPLLAIRPIKVDQRKFVKSFQTPVYTTTDRRNAMGVGFVFEADIQTNSHYSVWVMKGVCLLLNKE